MANFVITMDTMAAPAPEPIVDGEYVATIKRLEEPVGKNPYIACVTDKGQELRLYINSQASLEIITKNINAQLGIKDAMNFRQWIADPRVKDACISLWVLTTQYTDKDGNAKEGQNITPYKPAMFDAVMNGLI